MTGTGVAPRPRALVTGASGFVGSAVARALSRTRDVWSLTRRPSGPREIGWDPARRVLDPHTLEDFDEVVHLAGEPLDQRWTAERRRRIRDSRVAGTRLLAEALARSPRRPRVLLSASAMGWYGSRGDETLTEASGPGTGFLAGVCREWEAAADPAREAGIRVVHPRFGLVLGREGGVLRRLLLPFRLGIGARLGDGRAWWSWIALRDVTGALLHLLGSTLAGPVNVAAPTPARSDEFSESVAAALRRPCLLRIPAIALKLAFGAMAEETLLASQRIEPARLVADGYRFRDPELRGALESLLRERATA